MIEKLKSLKNHQGFMKYFKNTSWLFAEKILRMLVGLFVGIWVARYLGPEQFGLLSYAISFVGLFTAISTLGLNSIVIRELVKNESRRDELIGTAFWLKLLGAFAVLSILAIVINFLPNDSSTNILMFIIASATVFQSFNVIDFYFQAKVLSRFVVYSNVISLLLSSFIKILLIINEAPLVAFAWVVLFDSFILACGFIYFYLKNNPTYRIKNLKFNKSTAVDLLKDSWPLIFATVAMSINMRIDQVMIKEFLGAESVGFYAAAVKIVEMLAFLPHLIARSLFPSFINAYKNDNKLFIARIEKGYKYLFYFGSVLAIILYNFSDIIILYTYGEQYKESIYLLQLYSIAVILATIGAINAVYLKVINLQKKIMGRQMLNVVLNIIMNYYFIQLYGIKGAVFATLIALFVSTILYDMFDKKLIEMNNAKLKIFMLWRNNDK